MPSGPPVAPPPVNLQLQALSTGWAGTGRAVKWVLQRTSGEFTLHDIAMASRMRAALSRPKISVVLNRMMGAREITRIGRPRAHAVNIPRRASAPATARLISGRLPHRRSPSASLRLIRAPNGGPAARRTCDSARARGKYVRFSCPGRSGAPRVAYRPLRGGSDENHWISLEVCRTRGLCLSSHPKYPAHVIRSQAQGVSCLSSDLNRTRTAR